MKIAIITSKANLASITIKDCLLQNYAFVKNNDKHTLTHAINELELYTLEKQMLYLENIDKEIDADIFIFPSTHTSKAQIDALTVHAVGNFGNADFGGNSGQIGIAHASLMKCAFRKLWKNPFGIETIQEATHHGPYMEKPGMFIEIGSSEKMYRDKNIAKFVATVIMETIEEFQKENFKSATGIGGLHHCPNFSKVMLETNIAIGHVVAKHALPSLTKDQLINAMKRTVPKADLVIIDWKGLGEHKEKVRKLTEGLNVKRTADY